MEKKYLLFAVLIFSFLMGNAQKNFVQIGDASYYGDEFTGKYTASGEKYDHNKLTAAHLTLPFGTKVKVTNFQTNKSVVVTVNDRGPFVQGRIIDLSKSAAESIGMIDQGLVKVRVEVVPGGEVKNVVSQPKAQPVANQQPVKPATPEPKGGNTEVYKIDAAKIPASGFGVQVGSFNESFNFLGTVSEIKKQVNEPIFINVTKQNNTVFYKVIIGNVSNRKQADSLKNRLSNLFPGCFVVKF